MLNSEQNPDSELKWHKFSTVYQEDEQIFSNFYCHTFIILAPQDIANIFGKYDFYAFKDLENYQNFIRANEAEIIKNSNAAKNLYDMTLELQKKGDLQILFHETHVYHIRIDGIHVTKKWLNTDLLTEQMDIDESKLTPAAPKLTRKSN